MDSTTKLGQHVRRLRKKVGLTQLELSQKVFDKPNKQYISKLECGKLHGITLHTADKILRALDSEIGFN